MDSDSVAASGIVSGTMLLLFNRFSCCDEDDLGYIGEFRFKFVEKVLSIGEVVLEDWCGDVGEDDDVVEAANLAFLIGGLILETFSYGEGGGDTLDIEYKKVCEW